MYNEKLNETPFKYYSKSSVTLIASGVVDSYNEVSSKQMLEAVKTPLSPRSRLYYSSN